MFVSRYGYTDDSAWRGNCNLSVRAGSEDGTSIGGSPLRAARAEKPVRFGGGTLSSSLVFDRECMNVCPRD